MESHEAIDISHYQGNIDFGAVTQDIVIMKASQGTTYLDPSCYTFYDQAKHQHGKLVGLYHFANGEDATAEANWFLRACQPLEQFDVFVLDYEIHLADPVGWCNTFMNVVHDATGCWPLIYLNRSTLKGYDWSPVLANCGLWIADPDHNPDAGADTAGHTYVLHQYGTTNVAGVPDNVCDVDRWWGSEEAFKKYGYNYAPPTPTPSPTPVVTQTTVIDERAIPFTSTNQDDPTMDKGTTKTLTAGVNGVETITYAVTLTDGVETARSVASDVVTTPAVNEVIAVGTADAGPTPTPTPTPTPEDKIKQTIAVIISIIIAAAAAITTWVHSVIK